MAIDHGKIALLIGKATHPGDDPMTGHQHDHDHDACIEAMHGFIAAIKADDAASALDWLDKLHDAEGDADAEE